MSAEVKWAIILLVVIDQSQSLETMTRREISKCDNFG